MKRINFQNKSREELTNQYKELKSKLLKLNFDLVASKLKDVSQMKKVKKDIARILTEMKKAK